ncbi:MAG: hypothetical protein ABFR75_12660 [Acidobacteriota bacterium]
MYCFNCGNQLGSDEKYCGACGKPVRSYEQDSEPEQQKNSKLLILILAAGLAILVIGFVIYFNFLHTAQ